VGKYISLITETQVGETRINESVARATRIQAEAARCGVSVTGVYWTLGEYDGVLMFEAEKDETAAAFLHFIASKGAVRTHTLRAFDVDETRQLLENVTSKM